MTVMANRAVVWGACLTLVACAARAGTWESIGPEAGKVRSIGFAPESPATVYAALINGGVYKSADGGASWMPASGGLHNWEPLSILVRNANEVVMGTSAGIYRTADGGANWMAAGLSARVVYALAATPGDNMILFAGTDAGIYRSADGGVLWAAYGSGGGTDVRALAIQPGNAAIMYAGTNDPGSYFNKSEDGGAHWIPGGAVMAPVETLYVDPDAPTTLYAGTHAFLHKSTDGGVAWTPLFGAPPMTGRMSIAKGPGSSTLLCADMAFGLACSSNGGMSWNNVVDVPTQTIYALARSPDGNTLYVGGSFGVYRTTDGSDWQLAVDGMRSASLNTVIVNSTSDIYVTTAHGGLMRTGDGGATWSRVDDGSLTGDVVLARDPIHPDLLHAGTQGSGVLMSEDGGATWTPSAYAYSYVDWLGYVGTTLYVSADAEKLGIRTADGAWTSIAAGVGYTDAADWGANGTLFASEHGISKRLADGSFVSANNGMGGLALAVSADPGDAGSAYAATATSVYRSTDGGASWSLAASGLQNGAVLARDDANGLLYVGADGVYRKTGDGSWTALTGGALANRAIRRLAIHAPVDYDVTLYAAATDAGLFRYVVDTVPDPIDLGTADHVAKSVWIESPEVVIGGVEIPVTARISGGEFKVNGGSWSSGTARVASGDRIAVRHLSAVTELTRVDTTLQVGPDEFLFSSTTAADTPTPEPPPTDPLPTDPEPTDPEPGDTTEDEQPKESGGGALSLFTLLFGAALLRRRGAGC